MPYCGFAYSAFSSLSMGMSESASFRRPKESRQAMQAFAVSPARARPKCSSALVGPLIIALGRVMQRVFAETRVNHR